MAETSGSWESSMRRPSRASGSSSTISVVKGMDFHHFSFPGYGRGMIGKNHGRDRPAVLAIFQCQLSRIAVELLEARPRIRQPDAVALGRIRRRKAGAVIFDFELKHAVHASG